MVYDIDYPEFKKFNKVCLEQETENNPGRTHRQTVKLWNQ